MPNDDRCEWVIRGVARTLRDVLKDHHRRLVALPNNRVAPVKDVHRVQRKEQFAVVGVNAGVAKGEPAGTIVGQAGGGFVLETEADIGLAADVSCNVPELDVEIRKHAVDGHTVVKAVLMLNEVGSGIGPVFCPVDQPQKRAGSDRAFPREEPTGNTANRGLKDSRRAGWFRA